MESTSNKPTLLTKIILTSIALLLFACLHSCSSKNYFTVSDTTPAARGYAKVTKDGNKNNKIEVLVYNLAEVSRLQPPQSTYVVWMSTADNYAVNLGQIKSDNNFMSKKLKAKFTTTSVYKPQTIYITAETLGTATTPSSFNILTTKTIK